MTKPQSWTKSSVAQSPTVSETSNAKNAQEQIEVKDSQPTSRRRLKLMIGALHTIFPRAARKRQTREERFRCEEDLDIRQEDLWWVPSHLSSREPRPDGHIRDDHRPERAEVRNSGGC